MAIGAAIGGSLLQAGSASKAAKAQERAADRQIAVQERVYDETVERFAPFYDDGRDFQNALRYELLGGEVPVFGGNPMQIREVQDTAPGRRVTLQELRNQNIHDEAIRPMLDRGTGGSSTTRYLVGDQSFNTREAAQEYADMNPTGGQEYQGFQATPGYEFMLDQGQQAIDNSAASRGNLFSGATLKAQQSYGQGLANQEYNNYLNRLTQGAGAGQAAAANQANAGANFAAGTSNALANIGNAQAAGAIGVGNAINGGINNAIGLWNYQNMQNATPGQSTGIFGNWF